MPFRMPAIRISALLFIFLTVLFSTTYSAGKKTARIERIGENNVKELRAGYLLSTADTCIVRHDAGLYWRINGWVVGNELYKSYLDPAATCDLPYPFTIHEINMPMAFDAATPLVVSVDVEAVDYTDPSCPAPGELLAISAQYQFDVPGAGLYNVWVPLDAPIVVDGPFFAGFFIGNEFGSGVNPAVITDSIPVNCVSYNIWDTTIGYIDLMGNEFYNFPGRLVLYASGVTGGTGGGEPLPSIQIISPTELDYLFGFTNIWAWEKSGSQSIDYVMFETKEAGGSYTEIGRDFDGSKVLRDGINPASASDGFSYFWDFSTRPEGNYLIRVTAVDTAGNLSSDSMSVYLEPTPPVPTIISPNDGEDFCPDVQLLMSLFDEDFWRVDAYIKEADTFFSQNLVPLQQSKYGDNDNDSLDGNPVSEGEFGEYYSGPVAATQALRLWYDRGYQQFMKQGGNDIPINDFVELMATKFDTRNNRGTYEENLYGGLQEHLSIFGIADLDYYRGPDYYELRKWLEDEERAVILGLGGNPGLWAAVDGFWRWKQPGEEFYVRIADPVSGQIVVCLMHENNGISEIQLDGSWHSGDIMISVSVETWNVARQKIGTDADGNDGWSYYWTPSGLKDNHPYFFRAVGIDFSSFTGSSAIIMNYDCASFFTPGDYTSDGEVNLVDLVYLIDFIVNSGPEPVGGAGRADANCDNIINITDIVYYMNFIFGTASAPCY
jgi:hypothetical protein